MRRAFWWCYCSVSKGALDNVTGTGLYRDVEQVDYDPVLRLVAFLRLPDIARKTSTMSEPPFLDLTSLLVRFMI